MSDSYSTEESFHDNWARSIYIEQVMLDEFFEACTSPENRFIMKELGNIKGKRLLDLGCGAGESSVYLAKKGALVTAMDVSSEMLNVASNVAQKHNVEITTRRSSSVDINCGDETFDIVYAANLLHHVNIPSTLKEVHRVLKYGGSFVSWDPILYNPLINIYRKLATEVRTKDEHPLTTKDLDLFKQYFPDVKYHMTWFFTLLIFVKYYCIDRVHPNKERYWKKILIESKKLQKAYSFLEKLDNVFLKTFPFMKKYCWNVTVVAKK